MSLSQCPEAQGIFLVNLSIVEILGCSQQFFVVVVNRQELKSEASVMSLLIPTNCINKSMKTPGWQQHFFFNLLICIELYIFGEGRREWHKETQIQIYTDH